jgi:hypothetical protein
MVVFASAGVVLVLSVFAQHPATSIDQAPPGELHEIPYNLRIGDGMEQQLLALLARSRTLREQCWRIAAAPHARIAVQLTPRLLGSMVRARATARRYETGLLAVVIELPALSLAEFAELLAHELEHVVELIDQVDLPALSRQRATGVTRTAQGVFETERAKAAGRAAAAETSDDLDPAAAAFVRGFAKAVRVAWRGLKGFTVVKSPPSPVH